VDESWLPEVQRGAARQPEPVAEISDGWRARLLDKGAKRALANCAIALRHAPEWAGVVAFDDFANSVVFKKAPPWPSAADLPRKVVETDDIRGAEWCQVNGIACATPLTWAQAMQAHAINFRFHPVRDYLDGLKWDGDGRVDRWLTEYLGVEPSEYAAAVGARWLISAIARVFRPGTKADCVLILEGPQGARKSTALRVLGEPWFTDHLDDIGSKDSQIQIAGIWIVEWPELDAMSRVEVARIKAFVSRGADRFRPPYGHRLVDLARQSVFSGTTNSDRYLKDETGARRFWPVKCGAIDVDALRRDRDQLWAEALVRFRDGAVWWLDRADLVSAAESEQADRYEGGVWDSIIEPWVEGRESVSADEILGACIQKPMERWTAADRSAVGRAMRALGWERYKAGPRSARQWRYRPKSGGDPVTR